MTTFPFGMLTIQWSAIVKGSLTPCELGWSNERNSVVFVPVHTAQEGYKNSKIFMSFFGLTHFFEHKKKWGSC